MPSPLTHAAAAYFVYQMVCTRLPTHARLPAPSPALPLAVTIGFSILPDLDAVPGLLLGDLEKFHNAYGSSLLVGASIAVVLTGVARALWQFSFRRWVLITALCYELHVLMDFATVGRGVMLFWPLSADRFASPVKLFYGVHWSDGWLSERHLVALLSEIALIALFALAFRLLRRPQPLKH